ncbi:MAG: SDR family NAD(P)-dependent oxidoreductase, partial [Sphingobium sp.]
MTGRVQGKKALVTGAAQGLGAAMAAMLAREGAQVTLADINRAGVDAMAATINEAMGAQVATALTLDVSDAAAWSVAIDEAARAMDGLSVLVNNAGIAPVGNIEGIDPAV